MRSWMLLAVALLGCGATKPAVRPREAPDQPPAAPAPSAEPAPTPACEAPAVDAETATCLEKTPAQPAVQCAVQLARSRIRQGDEQLAANTLAAAIRHAPAQRTSYLELALLLQTNNRYDLAALVLGEAKRFVPAEERFLVHYLLASTHAALRQMAASVAELEAAYRLKPADDDIQFNLGLSYTKLSPRKTDKARSMLEPFVARCADGKSEAQCMLAKTTLERLDGKATWPADRSPQMKLAAYPAAGCTPPPAEAGKPALPPLTLPASSIRADSMFTVWGATHHMRSAPHRKAVTSGPITVVGYVAAVNYAEAPACAIHRAGKPTPESCDAPIPTLYLVDDLKRPTSYLPVMGWASSWSMVYEMMRAIDKEGEAAVVMDPFFGSDLPNPLPSVGAKVSVTGKYGFTYFSGSSPASDPRFGILSHQQMSVLEPAPHAAAFPSID